MYYEVLIQMCFCYHLLYFTKIFIFFLIVNFIRCHRYYFQAHNWLDHLGFWLSKSSFFIFIYPCRQIMAHKSRYLLYFKIITQNQIKCYKVSCFDESNKFFTYVFFNIIILYLTFSTCSRSCLHRKIFKTLSMFNN